MSERKFNRRDFLKLAGAGIVSASSLACGRTNIVSTPKRKSSESTLTKVPTETLVPTATSVPSATPIVTNTPEGFFEDIEKTPSIPDLAHLHLEGNTLKTEQGEYAGEIIEYIFNGEKTKGVVLIPSEVKKLMDKVNTPEAIAAGNWKIAFPLDARGSTGFWIRTWKPLATYTDFAVGGLSPDLVFLSPFIGNVRAGNPSVPGRGQAVDLEVPGQFLGEVEHYLTLVYPNGSNKISPGVVMFGLPIIWGVNGQLSLKNVPEIQVDICVAPVPGEGLKDRNITDNILTVRSSGTRDMMVFLGATS